MTEEEILADLEAYDKEPVPETTHPATAKAISPETVPTQADKGEVSAEKVGRVDGSSEEVKEEVKADEAGTEPEKQPSETKEEAEARVRDEKGRFVKASEETVKEDAPVGDAPEPSSQSTRYEKAKKEQERQKSLLAGFDEKQKRFAAEAAAKEAELERQRQQIEEEKLKIRAQRNGQRPVDEHGDPIYSSYELRELAKDYIRRAKNGEEGPNGENYLEVSERAGVAAERAAVREAKEQQELFERRQNQLAMEAMTSHPELADQNAPLTKEIQSVFAEEAELARKYERGSIFRMIPDGFERALDVAKLRRKAFEADEWKNKYEKSQLEVERLNKLTTLGSSSPIQARQPKPREQMTADELLDEMDAEARKQGAKIWNR